MMATRSAKPLLSESLTHVACIASFVGCYSSFVPHILRFRALYDSISLFCNATVVKLKKKSSYACRLGVRKPEFFTTSPLMAKGLATGIFWSPTGQDVVPGPPSLISHLLSPDLQSLPAVSTGSSECGHAGQDREACSSRCSSDGVKYIPFEAKTLEATASGVTTHEPYVPVRLTRCNRRPERAFLSRKRISSKGLYTNVTARTPRHVVPGKPIL